MRDGNESSTSASKSWLRSLRPLLYTAMFLGVIVLLLQSMRQGGLPEDVVAPPLRVQTTDGATFVLADQQQVTVLNFWGTWCPACRQELGVIRELSSKPDVSVLGLTLRSGNLDHLSEVKKNFKLPYPLAVANDSMLKAYRVEMVPTTLVIDRQGKVVQSFVGSASLSALLSSVNDAK